MTYIFSLVIFSIETRKMTFKKNCNAIRGILTFSCHYYDDFLNIDKTLKCLRKYLKYEVLKRSRFDERKVRTL